SVVERGVDRALSRRSDVSQAEARLARSLSAIPHGIVVFDADGAIAFRNKVAARYLSARHSEALVDEAIRDLAEGVLADHAPAAPSRAVDLFGPPRRALVLTAVRLEQRSEDLGALVLIDDVTDRRRLESIRRDFVANISHELKTPVGALGLLAETIGTEDDPEVARRLAARMMQEAFRVARTIDDLLELSQIEADPDGHHEDVPIPGLIAEAVDRVAGAAAQQGISIQQEAVPVALSVAGDRRQLVSAIYNLLDNAVKYSNSGSSVSVSALTDGRSVEVRVADHGVGVPRRDLERVFERFYRVDRARSRETGGTGLGLAIVRNIAENHGGSVHVESTEGTGSTFTLRLPARMGGAPKATDG
ncbi:MAG: ATP-binding protein, partial [Acidimicrobiales bacterium]